MSQDDENSEQKETNLMVHNNLRTGTEPSTGVETVGNRTYEHIYFGSLG